MSGISKTNAVDFISVGNTVNNVIRLLIHVEYKRRIISVFEHQIIIMTLPLYICLFICSALQSMDDEDKHDVPSETHLQVSDAACEYSESTDSDIEEPKMPRVNCEERRQELNMQSHVIPFNNSDQETIWTNDADETIQVKQEKKEYPDGYDRSSEVARHWVVCPGGVLKEVKAEHTSDVSHILSAEDGSVNVGSKLRTNTCTHHNNIHDEEMNGERSTYSTCDESFIQFRRHDNILKVQQIISKQLKHFTVDACGEQLAHLSELELCERTHTCVKPFTCDTCGKSFTQSGDLKRHDMIHTGVKPFTCDTCGKSFARSGYLKIHERIHTGVKQFTCDICGNSFSQSGHRKKHEMRHKGVKPFRCDTCGKSFTQPWDLKIHNITHTGIRPFTCDTCGKAFTLSGYLKIHERVHTGVKPFTCDTCGKAFIQSGDLKRHERIHTGVKPFLCDTCGKSFARLETLKRHERIHPLLLGAYPRQDVPAQMYLRN